MSQTLDARLCAYIQLQAIQAKHPIGSRRYEQVEHALDLALNDTRAVDDFLIRNVLRDSERVLNRQASRRMYVEIAEDGRLQQEGGPKGFDPKPLIDFTTPESLFAAEQIAQAIAAKVARFSPHAVRVMEGLLAGETIEETARATGISPARVNQLRRALRNAATEFEAGCHD